MNFKNYVENEDNWRMKRSDLIKMWSDLPPQQPLRINPVSDAHQGSRYGQDGIRITGSGPFIQSVLSRFKDFLSYDERADMKVDAEMMQITPKGVDPKVDSAPRFSFYAYLEKK